MSRPRTPAHDKVIARLTPDTRLRILAAIRPDTEVVVEHGYSRRVDDGSNRTTAGTVVGVAFVPGSSTEHAFVIRGHEVPAGVPRWRSYLVAIPEAHVIRIRAATLFDRRHVRPDRHGRAYDVGEVLAGPPLAR